MSLAHRHQTGMFTSYVNTLSKKLNDKIEHLHDHINCFKLLVKKKCNHKLRANHSEMNWLKDQLDKTEPEFYRPSTWCHDSTVYYTVYDSWQLPCPLIWKLNHAAFNPCLLLGQHVHCEVPATPTTQSQMFCGGQDTSPWLHLVCPCCLLSRSTWKFSFGCQDFIKYEDLLSNQDSLMSQDSVRKQSFFKRWVIIGIESCVEGWVHVRERHKCQFWLV